MRSSVSVSIRRSTITPTRLQVRKMESRSCVIITTVSRNCFCRYSISSSNSAAPIGSRPEVGSSRNSSRGSSASARASAARLTMPPESSAGYLRAASAGRPTRRIFSMASSSRAVGGQRRQVLDHRQLHVLQHVERGIQRALLEGHAVARLHRAQRAAGELGDVLALDADRAGLRPLQAEDAPQQHRFAGAGAADDAETPRPRGLPCPGRRAPPAGRSG